MRRLWHPSAQHFLFFLSCVPSRLEALRAVARLLRLRGVGVTHPCLGFGVALGASPPEGNLAQSLSTPLLRLRVVDTMAALLRPRGLRVGSRLEPGVNNVNVDSIARRLCAQQLTSLYFEPPPGAGKYNKRNYVGLLENASPRDSRGGLPR